MITVQRWRAIAPGLVAELEEPELADDGVALVAWGRDAIGREVLWRWDPTKRPGQQVTVVAIEFVLATGGVTPG